MELWGFGFEKSGFMRVGLSLWDQRPPKERVSRALSLLDEDTVKKWPTTEESSQQNPTGWYLELGLPPCVFEKSLPVGGTTQSGVFYCNTRADQRTSIYVSKQNGLERHFKATLVLYHPSIKLNFSAFSKRRK